MVNFIYVGQYAYRWCYYQMHEKSISRRNLISLKRHLTFDLTIIIVLCICLFVYWLNLFYFKLPQQKVSRYIPTTYPSGGIGYAGFIRVVPNVCGVRLRRKVYTTAAQHNRESTN